jgi:DNA-binding SARP family transcriptional activator
VDFRIQGPLEVTESGRPLPPGRQRFLLAILLLNAGEPVSAGGPLPFDEALALALRT